LKEDLKKEPPPKQEIDSSNLDSGFTMTLMYQSHQMLFSNIELHLEIQVSIKNNGETTQLLFCYLGRVRV
jgi:hypothetical protein